MDKNTIKELNIEIKYYLKSIGKMLIDAGNDFDIEKYNEPKDIEKCNLVDCIKYICYVIAINGDYRKNPIHFLIKDLKSENHWQLQIWKIFENSALDFVLHFARLRRSRLHKDKSGKSFGDVKGSNVHIGTQV